MKMRKQSLFAFTAALTTISCSPVQTPPVRTIEPGESKAAASDSAFVLSRKPSKKKAVAHEESELPIHISEAWWPLRSSGLGISESQARDRDAAISDRQAPRVFWDNQTSTEAVAIWTSLCNECHGGRRNIEDASTMPPPAPGWGVGTGLFFGARRPYQQVFNIIYNGGPDKDGVESEMPVWKGKLSKELIWAILYFLEYQSGGIEGRFPPSLYPRRPESLR